MAMSLRTRPAGLAHRARTGAAQSVLPARSPLAPARRHASVRVAAEKEMDFDAVLNVWAEKYEKLENKPVAIGYIVAGVSALIITEWLIHLPALDILLGFPIQLVGVVMTPILLLRYLADKKDVSSDVLDTVADITKRLPGLDK